MAIDSTPVWTEKVNFNEETLLPRDWGRWKRQKCEVMRTEYTPFNRCATALCSVGKQVFANTCPTQNPAITQLPSCSKCLESRTRSYTYDPAHTSAGTTRCSLFLFSSSKHQKPQIVLISLNCCHCYYWICNRFWAISTCNEFLDKFSDWVHVLDSISNTTHVYHVSPSQ